MYKSFTRVLFGLSALILSINSVFAIDAEFKNTLMKVDLIKSSEDVYSINLYTKNKFLEPVKVIKKSDLNYYILLPETKNESVRNSVAGTDIRDFSMNVYPYAGADVNNGYVKININTSKPLSFKVNVKDEISKAEAVNNEAIAQANASSEKKNFNSSNSKSSEQVEKKNNPRKIRAIPAMTIEKAVQEEIERIREEKNKIVHQDSPSNVTTHNDYAVEEEPLLAEDLIATEDKNNNELLPISKFDELKNMVASFLSRFGIKTTDFLMFVSAFIVAFVLMLVLLRRKEPSARLKTKAELNEEITPKFKKCEVKNEVKNDGQYFVFDKNIKQTGFCDPATSAIKRNYELSSYEPELKNKYSREKNISTNSQSEYDIIQKILKEDTFIDVPAGTYAQNVKQEIVAPAVSSESLNQVAQEKKEIKTSEPIKQNVIKTPCEKIQKVEQSEPDILSKVEIAPSRGFMCVSYNENIALIGYIFDDVFALYNFKSTKLENYQIQYRLSEKDDKSVSYIVKVANTKMLIKVEKSKMYMEVLL